jgi:hypothetical protein
MSPADPLNEQRNAGAGRRARGGVWVQAQVLAAGGTEFGGTVALLCLLGWWLDRKWGSSPAMILTGLVIGVIGGTLKLFRLQQQMYRTGPGAGPEQPRPNPSPASGTESSDGSSEHRRSD